MTKFVCVSEDTFVNVDKIIRICKSEGQPHHSEEGKFQHKMLASDGEYHWTGCYDSPFQWVLYTSNSWDGIFRVTDPEYFQGVEDLLK